MMRLEQFLSDHLRSVLAERRLLTVFDPRTANWRSPHAAPLPLARD